MQIFKVTSNNELEKCYPIMKELRPHLVFEDFIAIYHQAHIADGYEIVGIEKEGQILALMGYRFLADYVRGRHLYIDDLISSQDFRSQGLGAQLLKYAESIAKENECRTLRLCTGIENELGKKFYDRQGWIQRAIAYTKKI